MISTSRKINAISLNIKINKPKFVHWQQSSKISRKYT